MIGSGAPDSLYPSVGEIDHAQVSPHLLRFCLLLTCLTWGISSTLAQTAPSAKEIAGFSGLHAAAHNGELATLQRLVAEGVDLEARDRNGRTPLHVAAFASRYDTVRALIESGADPNAMDNQAYDILTIAAVTNDLQMVDLALKLGASVKNITSPYDGTALIAAAHLGYVAVVEQLIAGGAHWTMSIISVGRHLWRRWCWAMGERTT